MMPSGSGGTDTPQKYHQRALWEHKQRKMPVILSDDDQLLDDQDNMGDHDHHDHDNMGHQAMDHSQHSSSHNGMHGHAMMMGQGTTMYMDGFRSALFSQPPPPCLILFSPSWTLASSGSFAFAMAFVTLIGMLVEACGVWRVKCLRRGRRCRREAALRRLRQWEGQQPPQLQGHPPRSQGVGNGNSDMQNISLEGSIVLPPHQTPPSTCRRMRRYIRTARGIVLTKACRCFLPNPKNDDAQAKSYETAGVLLHAARAALGYLLMLAVMTYAVEFLFCAVFGMVLGRHLSVDAEGSDTVVAASGASGALDVGGVRPGAGMATMSIAGNSDEWGGGDPCCGIDDGGDDDDSNQSAGLAGNGMVLEPLLSSVIENHMGGVARRGGGGR